MAVLHPVVPSAVQASKVQPSCHPGAGAGG